MDGAGTLQGRWSLAVGKTAGRGCAICRGPVLPGLKLCGACRAALKRARQATVSQELTAPRIRTRRAKAPVAANAAPAKVVPARPTIGARHVAIAIGAVAAVLVAGFVAVHLVRPVGHVPAAPAPPALPAVAPAPKVAAEVAVPRASLKPAPDPAAASRVPPTTASPARRAAEPAPPPRVPMQDRIAVPTEVPAPEPPPAPIAVVAPPRPAPPPDRWQLLAGATAACAAEPFLARVVCAERARLQYCEGFWGQVEQCPAPNANDHGR